MPGGLGGKANYSLRCILGPGEETREVFLVFLETTFWGGVKGGRVCECDGFVILYYFYCLRQNFLGRGFTLLLEFFKGEVSGFFLQV